MTLLGLLTLGQYLFGVDFGIDQALVRDLSSPPSLPPGRMGANTALCFALAGGALLLLDTRSRALAQLAQDMTILALLVALVALVGYAYSVAYLTRIASATQMATHTAVAFVALGVGLIVARPRRPFAAMLASASPGGVLLRRVLPQVILLFVLLGWLRLEGERLGLYEHAFGTGLLVLAGIVLFALLIWRAARTLNRLEAERREAEASEREVDARLRVTLRSIGDAVISTDTAGRVSFVNPVAESLTGWTLAEAEGRPLTEVFHIINEQTRAEVENPVTKVIREGAKVGLANHTVLVARDGREIPIDDSGAPIGDEAGEIVGAVLIFRDVSERKRAEQALRESEERYRIVAETATDAIITIDEHSAILYVNPAAERVFGYRAEELIGQSLTKLMPEYLRHVHQAGMRRYLTTGERHLNWEHVEMPGLHRDGHEIPLELSFGELLTGGRRIFVGIARDVTERKLAEDRLRESQQQYEALVRTSAQIVWETNAEGAVESDSPTWREFTGQSFDEWKGFGWLDAFHPDDRERVAGEWQKSVETKTPIEIEYRVRYRSGEWRWTIARATPILNADGSVRKWVGMNTDITERKRTENLLRETEERFRATFEQAAVGIAQVAPDGRWLLVNQRLCEIVGYTQAELLARTFQDITHPDDLAADLDLVRQVLAGEIDTYSMEKRYIRKDGSIVWVNLTVALVREATGEPKYFISVVEDITKRKRAEQELTEGARQQQALYQLAGQLHHAQSLDDVYDVALDATLSALQCDRASILLFDDAGVMRFVAWRGLSDVYRKAVEGHSPWKPDEKKTEPIFVNDVETAEIDAPLKAVIKTEGIGALAFIPLISAGKLVGKFMTYFNSPHVFDDDELAIGLIIARQLAFGIDRQRAEEALRYQSGLTRTITDNAQSCLWMMDTEGRCTFANPASERISGFRSEELIGQVLHYKVHHTRPDGAPFPMEECPLDRVLPLQESIIGYEGVFIHKDGHFYPVRCTGRPIFKDGEPVGTVIEVQDITEEKRLLEAERRAREQAEVANRLKDEFLATVSHELRTPLNSILGWTVMLRSGRLKPDKAAEALETIERSARAQNRLVEDLLDVSRIITGKVDLKFQQVALAKVVEAAVAAARPAAEAKSIALQVAFDSRPCEVTGDADRLQQVIWNLISNAVKFTPRGGRVEVSVECVNSQVEIKVSDTGEGIAPEFLPHVFDRFRQADGSIQRRHGGLGLGLAIVRHLVELHGGEVGVENPGPGQGATFTVKLPLAAARTADFGMRDEVESAVRNLQFAISEGAPRLGGVKVLVVDDEADARALLMEILAGRGAEVRVASGMAEALSLLNEWRPDVLISDIGMPNGSGYDLIREVRRRDALGTQLPAVALTAYARTEDRVQALSAGFHMHVPKPIEPKELLAVIASLTG